MLEAKHVSKFMHCGGYVVKPTLVNINVEGDHAVLVFDMRCLRCNADGMAKIEIPVANSDVMWFRDWNDLEDLPSSPEVPN